MISSNKPMCSGSGANKDDVGSKVDPFLNLFFHFAGADMSACPKQMTTASELLNASNRKLKDAKGDLIIVDNNNLYVYGHDHKRKLKRNLAGTSAFFPLASVSHIGPMMAYLLQTKDNGDSIDVKLQSYLTALEEAREYNLSSHWIDQADLTGFSTHKSQITDMINYGLLQAADYISQILSKQLELNSKTLTHFLTYSSEAFPIPFNNVMIGTMLLMQLYTFAVAYQDLMKLNLHWPTTKVLIQYKAGGNVTAGGSPSNNFYVPFFERVSNNQLDESRIYIVPYLLDKTSLGEDELTEDDFNYFQSTWDTIMIFKNLSDTLFPTVADITKPEHVSIPGDYDYSPEGCIEDFVKRLKYSLKYPEELVTNCVGFWIVEELYKKNWDFSAMNLPGLTSGFPDGITAYPKVS